MGDKTQLLALLLTVKFKKPWTILAGVLVATIFNHGLAAWGGSWLSTQFSQETLKWTLASSFFIFACWILIPDKEEKWERKKYFGAFLTTVIAFFIAEMGDKTQLATIALAAKYTNITTVTIGSTFGMMASNGLAIFFGNQLLKKIPLKWIRIFASLLFFLFGVMILKEY